MGCWVYPAEPKSPHTMLGDTTNSDDKQRAHQGIITVRAEPPHGIHLSLGGRTHVHAKLAVSIVYPDTNVDKRKNNIYI